MHKLIEILKNPLIQLRQFLLQLDDEKYVLPIPSLSSSTIGQHTRHIVELYKALNAGYARGEINYESRERNQEVETVVQTAVHEIDAIINGLNKENKELTLSADFGTDEKIKFNTNYLRELAFNLDHTIHHMALIKVGALSLGITNLPEGFGVSGATIKYHKNVHSNFS